MRRALGLALLLTCACRRGPAARPAPVSSAAPSRPPQAAPLFRPPSDGRLTEAQLRGYLAAARVLRTGGAGEAWASQEAAVRASGLEPEELAWVRLKVEEARFAIESREADRANAATLARTAEALRRVAAATTDEATRERLRREIEGLAAESSEIERRLARPSPPDLAANEVLVRRHRTEIERIGGGAP